MLEPVGTHARGHFMFMGFLGLSLVVFGPILYGLVELSDYLETTRHFAFLSLPLVLLGLLCLYWMFWFAVKSAQYFLGDRTFFQSIQASCLDWWLCFRRVPVIRRFFRNPVSTRQGSDGTKEELATDKHG